MSHVPYYNSHLTMDIQELRQDPRKRDANASSARSRSAPGSRNDRVREGTSLGPNSTHQSVDTTSRSSAISTSISKDATGVQIIRDPDLDRGNARMDSDRSSYTGGPPKPDLGTWDERNLTRPRTNLTILDVAALVLNKQIGTGIFTTPGAVLLSTQSKGLSIALWAIGGFWSLMFLFIYLEFGNAFPYNGAELVYLDEIYYKPTLLATILFSGYFLTLANAYGNSIQFAKHVMVAALPELQDSTKLDSRVLKFIAVIVITLVCLIHWHSSRAGLFLNKLLAWYKICLLITVFIAGMIWSGSNGPTEWENPAGRRSTTDGMAGMVLVFYSFQGWENANYVAGEIGNLNGRTSKRTLNIGATLGVTTTWVLYVLVTVAFYRVLGYKDLTDKHRDIAVALKYAPAVFNVKAATSFKICMAISAFGNVLAVTYTASKVKQSIAIQRILPFWRYLQADQGTPKGALVLHWITCVIFIAATPTNSDGYTFAAGFYTYGHILFSVFVALGLFKLRKRMRTLPGRLDWNYTFFHIKPILYTVPFLFALGNVLILVFAGKTQRDGEIPRWWWPVVLGIILLVSLMWWAGMQVLRIKTSTRDPVTGEYKTVGDLVGLSIRIEWKRQGDVPPILEKDIDEALSAKVDGSGRRVIAETNGWLASLSKSIKNCKEFMARYVF